jgi:hypothetical protein
MRPRAGRLYFSTLSPPRPCRSTSLLGRLLADARSRAGHHRERIRSAVALLPTFAQGARLAMMNALILGEIAMWIGRRRVPQAL